MPPQSMLYALHALLVGALFSLQMVANAQLAKYVGGSVASTTISFAVGLVTLIVLNALVFRQFFSFSDLAATPPFLLMFGGMVGSAILVSNVFLAPRFGAAATLCFFIGGQLLAALAIDQLGLFGFAVRTATPGRIVGVLMALTGAVLVRLL
jgi:bacterial/archaeal transporter family-2 protein